MPEKLLATTYISFASRLFVAVFAVLASACSSETAIENTGNDPDVNESGAVCTMATLEYEGFDESRSTLSLGPSGMLFAWEEGEKIFIYSDANNNGDFVLQTGAGGSTGAFDGGGFSLTEGKTYYGINKSLSAFGSPSHTNIPADGMQLTPFTNIQMSYAGQRMVEDNSTEHLGKYDVQVATAVADKPNHARFNFSCLGSTLRLIISGLPAGVRFTELSMYDASEDLFREPARTFNMGGALTDGVFSPAWNEPEITESSSRFSIKLGKKVGDEEQGIEIPSTGILNVFMEVPPFDFTGKTIAFRLIPKEGQKATYNGVEQDRKPWFCLYKTEKQNITAGKAKQMKMTAQECTQYTINLQIMHDWHNGNTQSQSRATAAGDPGTAIEDELPTHLYAFFVNNGKLVQTATMVNIPASDWKTANRISTLQEGVGWTIAKEGSKSTTSTKLTLDNQYTNNPKVYIVAATSALTFSGLDYNTEESAIQALTYNYVSQQQMLGLFSTPYCEGSAFSGYLRDDVKDVRLYHVASKVDVNWESEAALPTTGDNAKVSVNNFQITGLSIFKPTTGNTGTGAGTVSEAITPGTAHNGRTVFYIPQPASATYNVTVGGATQNITFSPNTVYTSWFRGLITK